MKEIVAYNAGWVHSKSDVILTDRFCRIFLFYVINTPCGDLSSSSKHMRVDYNWPNDVWKKDTLKNALYSCANLDKNSTPPTYEVCTDSKLMHEGFVKVNLNGNFHSSRGTERICIFKPSKYSEFLAICYHIRNALAHGRFSVYGSTDADRIYVMEDGVHSGTTDFEIRSRLILREQTLIDWMDIIEGGPASLATVIADEHQAFLDRICDEINSGNNVTKTTLVRTFHKKEREISACLKELKNEGRVRFDNSQRSWVTITNE